MKIRAIIDTNVWISSFINRKGYPSKLKNYFINSQFESIISIPLIEEISKVTKDQEFNINIKLKNQK